MLRRKQPLMNNLRLSTTILSIEFVVVSYDSLFGRRKPYYASTSCQGAEFCAVWKQHCSDDRLLQDYSTAMKELATNVWDADCDGRDRTKWCTGVSVEYFRGGGLLKLLRKDERRKMHYEKEKSNFLRRESEENAAEMDKPAVTNLSSNAELGKLKLLDVGSCFNPFASVSVFETTAIDLSPATETVRKCDFLSVEVCHEPKQEFVADTGNYQVLLTLPAGYFNVVVFSLLLSYVPCPHSRWLMCEKAHQLLGTNGLLLIITPDSSHQNRHAVLMKKWKISIEKIGFQRVKYEKDKHFHFLAFRKLPSDFIWDRRKQEKLELDDILNIPQDFTDRKKNDNEKNAKVVSSE